MDRLGILHVRRLDLLEIKKLGNIRTMCMLSTCIMRFLFIFCLRWRFLVLFADNSIIGKKETGNVRTVGAYGVNVSVGLCSYATRSLCLVKRCDDIRECAHATGTPIAGVVLYDTFFFFFKSTWRIAADELTTTTTTTM